MATTNSFGSMKADMKDSYSDDKKKKKRFNRTKTLMQPKGKATAELDASKNPQKFMADNKNMKIPKKGFAF